MNCAICGSPHKVEHAHVEHKGMGGRGVKADESAHVTFPLCAGTGGNTDPMSCHGAHHAGWLLLEATASGLRYSVTASAPPALKRRLKTKDGIWHTAAYTETDFDAVDALPESEPEGLGEIEHVIRGYDEDEGTAYYTKARALYAALILWQDTYGETGGWQRFKAWRRENLGMGDSVASRLLTVAKHLPEPRGLTASYQYVVARAIKGGLDEAEALLDTAELMPQRDFQEAFGMLPNPRTEPELTCPQCDYSGPQSRFRGGDAA